MVRKYLERIDWDCKNGFYLLGYLYARGLGGPKDIARGVELTQEGKCRMRKQSRPCGKYSR